MLPYQYGVKLFAARRFMKRVGLLLAAALFAALFLLSFLPGLLPGYQNVLFWVGQAGLALCLLILLTIGTGRKRPK